MNPDEIYQYAQLLDYTSLKNLCSINTYFHNLCRTERFKQLLLKEYKKTILYRVSQLKLGQQLVLIWHRPNRSITLTKTSIVEESSPSDISLLGNILLDRLKYHLTENTLKRVTDRLGIEIEPFALTRLGNYLKLIGINVNVNSVQGDFYVGIANPSRKLYNYIIQKIEQENLPDEIEIMRQP